MKNAQKNRLCMRAVPLAIVVAFAPNVWAQASLEEVVVTAQRRAERLQDIPLSITTITGADMEQRGMEGAASLRGAVPNLNMAPAPVSGLIGSVGMRGMSSGQPSIWQDPSVGIYVDGVFVGKNQGILSDLVDIDRLEVLRGPPRHLVWPQHPSRRHQLCDPPPFGHLYGQRQRGSGRLWPPH